MDIELTQEEAQRMQSFGKRGNWGYQGYPHTSSKCISADRRDEVKELINQRVLYADIQKHLHISSDTIVKINKGFYDDR